MPRVHVHAEDVPVPVIVATRTVTVDDGRGRHRVHRADVLVRRRAHREPRELPASAAAGCAAFDRAVVVGLAAALVTHRGERLASHRVVVPPSESQIEDLDGVAGGHGEQRVRDRTHRERGVGHLETGQPRDGDGAVVQGDDVNDVYVARGARRDEHGDVALVDAVRAPEDVRSREIGGAVAVAVVVVEGTG